MALIESIDAPVRVSQAQFGAQHDPGLTVLTGGRQVAVWTDDWTPGGDGSEYSIKARLLDASGAVIGNEFVVNTTAPGRQDLAGITALASGGFVIAWLDGGVRFGGSVTNFTIRAQEYDAEGARVGGERLVGTGTGRESFVPSLVGLDGGGWAIAWQDFVSLDGSVKGRVYGVPGGVDGAAWQIDRPTSVTNFFIVDKNPTLVAANDGGFLVSWLRDVQDYRPQPGGGAGPYTNAAFVQARGSDGSALAAPVELVSQTTTTNDTKFAPVASVAVTQADDGRVLATWVKGSFFGGDVFARGFGADGIPLGATASLGTLTEGMRNEVIEIDLLSGGGAVISHNNQGWRINADGSADGAGFRLAADSYGSSGESSVDVTADGIAVAYVSVAARAESISVAQLSFAITPIADITLSGRLDEMAPGGVTLLRLGSDTRILDGVVTYELLADPRGLFRLTGDTLALRTGGKLDFETRPTETITVRATDAAGNQVIETFVIAVVDVATEGSAFDAGATIIASESRTSNLSGPVVAGLTDDQVVLAWEGFGIHLGVFDRGGSRLVFGGAGDANARAPQLVVLANGDFGLSYASVNSSFFALYAARFTPEGVAAGSRQQFGGVYTSGGDTAITAFGNGFAFSFEPVVALNYSGSTASTTLGSGGTRSDPDLATLTDGRVVAVWSQNGSVQARLVGSDRVATGPTFRIDATGGGEAEVAALGDGGFVVGHAGPQGTTVEVRRFDAAGVAVGAVVAIDGFGVSVAALSDGGFVAGYSVTGPVPDSLELYVQRFDASGAAVGGPAFIAAGTIFDLSPIDLATLPLGGFAAAWSDGGGVKVRNFDLAGRPTAIDDAVVTREDVAVAFTPLANDVGDALVLVSARVDTGSVAIGPDGITFTPDADWNGVATIIYRIASATGAIDDGVAKVTVIPVNDAPVATPVRIAITPGGTVLVPVDDIVAAGARDIDDSLLTLAGIGDAIGVIAQLQGTDVLVSVGAGAGQFTATIADAAGATVASRVDVALVAATAGDDRITVEPGTLLSRIAGGAGNDSITGADGRDTLHGEAGNDMLDGDAGDDVLSGEAGSDTLIAGSGQDALLGGDGNDGLFFGEFFDVADLADGGDGFDQVGLQGDYSGGVTLSANSAVGIELFVLLPGSDTRFGAPGNQSYSYNIFIDDLAIAAGQQLVFQANTLRAGESFSLNASGEFDGLVFTYAGQGSDSIIGSQTGDAFFFGTGRFNAGDVVDGQDGIDQIGLQGSYSGANAIVLGADQIFNVEAIVLLPNADTRFGSGTGTPFSYDLTTDDGNVAEGQRLTIQANTLASNEVLRFNGSAEADGSFSIFAGNGNDVITGSQGGDTISGRGGADTLTGGGGNDIFLYTNISDSTAAARDMITDFAAGDRIDLSRIDAITGGTDNAFTLIGAAGFSNVAGQLRVNSLGGGVFAVEGDINGDGAADFSIHLTNIDAHPITTADFLL